ncbi:Peptidase, ArgE/DapE family [uncultured Desulfatiglans sp.]|nr:Peptidase, ArgE/DapE family [uncultured Desulfatiglans sp.]
MMNHLDQIFARIDACTMDVIQLQTELTARVALGPENGGTGEHEKIAYVKTLLEELHPTVIEEFHAIDSRVPAGYRPNLVARWGEASEAPAVWILSHADIVPPGDLNLWHSDPYKVVIEEDRVVGRGVEDNQHGIVSSYLALKAVLDAGAPLARPVGLAIVADEETGSEYGLVPLLAQRSDLFKKSDWIVVPDAGNETGTMIEVAEKSMLWLKLTVTGRQTHASTPHRGNNCLYGAARLITTFDKIKSRFSKKDQLFSPPVSTFECTKIEANVPNVNTVPGRQVFYMDCRILPVYEVETVIGAIGDVAAKVAQELDLKVDIQVVQRQDATEATPADAPVVKALERAVLRVTGREARPMGIGGGTFAAFFRRAGYPAAVWSTAPHTAHQPNESCPIPDILSDAKVFACLFVEG